jgi:hypothetical protein
MSWFCEGGSTKVVRDGKYFATVVEYIDAQRAHGAGTMDR